jgi:membrane-bound lytic murein transglycosylase F
MDWIKKLFLLAVLFSVAACDYIGAQRPLPFPTPAQQDLVVLTRPGLLTYALDDNGHPTGLEYDLTQAFAQELGVGVKYIVAERDQLAGRLTTEQYHIAAAWLSPADDSELQVTPPIYQTRDLLVQHEASLALTSPSQLSGQTVHVMAGTRQAETLKKLAGSVSKLKVVEVTDGDIVDLLEKLGDRQIDYVAIDEQFEDIANQHVPNLRTSLPLGEAQPVVWALGTHPNIELRARLDAFIERIQHDGTLARLEDRYLGHVRRLNQSDIVTFLGQVEQTLPKYRKYFQAAQVLTGIDWRLIAAVAYHESHWDPNATSYTNVRGMMMLTEETADRLEVSNRLDPSESILAGARYINMLKDALPDEVEEPDRSWQALAAYNIGPGHFNAARTLAKQLKVDPNAWYEMKRVLPKLAQPKVYQQLKIGRARGGEAVILVENIRSYYDILQRNAPPLKAASASSEGLKRLVQEVEARRKAYAKQVAAARSMSALEDGKAGEPTLKLPAIDAVPGFAPPRDGS